MGLVRPLQPWDILSIYCNNQLKKVYKVLAKTSKGGTLHPPSDVYVRSFLSFHTLIKLCYTKALEWSKLLPSPEAKSTMEIMTPTSFTVSCQYPPWSKPTTAASIAAPRMSDRLCHVRVCLFHQQLRAPLLILARAGSLHLSLIKLLPFMNPSCSDSTLHLSVTSTFPEPLLYVSSVLGTRGI